MVLMGLSACTLNGKKPEESHRKGNAIIYVDESFKPLFESAIEVFQSQFPKSSITAVYSSENDILNDFLDNKTKTICISRDLTKKEKDNIFVNESIKVRSERIAIDAIALIVHPDNKDTIALLDELKSWLTEPNARWNASGQKINIVFDNDGTANFVYLSQLVKGNKLSENLSSLRSNREVLQYVKQNKNALGIIGVNWISDIDDPNMMGMRKGIKVMYVRREEGIPAYQPYAGNIWSQEYPLCRDLWIINRANKAGINTGFMLFMTGEKGQLIIQKSELVPAKAPVRLFRLE
ncbi:MAG: PstS family phosphate ABC transporter substrate-binding protein [Flavobacteriales bacterium]